MQNRIEKEKAFWNSFAKKYDSFINKNASKSYERLFESLLHDTKTSTNLLEIATGTGILSFKLCDQIPHITAIDIAAEMIEIAKSKSKERQISNISFQVGDSCKLEYDNEAFDTILASNVLHLLYHPDIALKEMTRVLKPDGKIIIPTFCHGDSFKSHFLSRLMGLAGFKARNRWSVESFKIFVEKCGLKIIKSEVFKDKIPFVYLQATKV